MKEPLEIDPSQFRYTGAGGFQISATSTEIGELYSGKKHYRKLLGAMRDEIDELQHMMYAHDRYGLLCIFQAMDAAGKDGTIRRVFSGVNPHGLEVHSFKKPSDEELDHDFLWRTTAHLPPRGRIGVFNRSYYEEVLVCKVHPEIVTQYQRLPKESLADMDEFWRGRYEDIRALERYAHRNGIHVLKFFLNLSKEEQARRFLSRLEEPEKNWKFSEGDLEERELWNDYQRAYERAIIETSTPESPWCVIPADDKRNMRLIVAALILEKLRSLDIHFPEIDDLRREEIKAFEGQLRSQIED